MLIETASTETDVVRAQQGTSALLVDRSTRLQDLGFASLTDTVLVTRLERRLGAGAPERVDDEVALPSTVKDLAGLPGTADQRARWCSRQPVRSGRHLLERVQDRRLQR